MDEVSRYIDDYGENDDSQKSRLKFLISVNLKRTAMNS